MRQNEIEALAMHGKYKDGLIRGKIEETHISWVILTRKNAFKIKKPLTLSFLDFSTLELRRKYCEREVQLNSRFSNIYLYVLPVRVKSNSWMIGGESGELQDYAVVMKRMAVAKRMDNLLTLKKVTKELIKALAIEIASFHARAEKIFSTFNADSTRGMFNDIATIKNFVLTELGVEFSNLIEYSMEWSRNFLHTHSNRLQRRVELGFKRDVHGDLHAGNIFLYRKPILFDCIEFNDEYRQIDVLYEVAFLCMDLEAFGQERLSEYFFTQYTKNFHVAEEHTDKHIFTYFKCLRANIRAKVHAVQATQSVTGEEHAHHLTEVCKYLLLMKRYTARR